uniref:hypothetical protein n=1 Tax=Salmonella sp. TaxID=599 RepID=UPI001CDA167C|nr:hypothetical protein [Salmonella sp.]
MVGRGTGIINDLVYPGYWAGTQQLLGLLARLPGSAGSWLNIGIQQTQIALEVYQTEANNAIFGSASAVQEQHLAIPQLPTVTDLARSGIRQPLTTDAFINNDPAMLKALLDNICSI